MKKNFIFVLLGIVAVLTSCNKEEVGGLATNKATSFNVSVDGGVQTRFTPVNDLKRFVMEVYKGPVATGTPVKHIEQANGTFTEVLLNDKQEYTVLFWADYGTPGTAGTNDSANEYNATNLKAARVAEDKQPTQAAYSGVKKFTVGTTPEADYTNVLLTHSVAQVNFIQTEALTAAGNTLEVSYPESYSVNVGDNSVTKIPGAITHTFTCNSTATGTLVTSYLIAAEGTSKTVLDITATLNNETPKTVSNVPFQRNYRTNISGAYSSKYAANLTVTCDDVWEKPENDVVFPKIKVKVGDFYYQDKTFSSTYIDNAQNPCIGIVFVVNDDGTTGKIVSLDEATDHEIVWSTHVDLVTKATDPTDGASNTKIIVNLTTYSAENYPAFAWCATKNPPATAGITWYLPAIKELRQLYAAMSGLKWVASGASTGEISDWGNYNFMPNYEAYDTDRTAFNNKFTTAHGTAIELTNDSFFYWSSTENSMDSAYLLTSSTGRTGSLGKNFNYYFLGVRAVSAF